MHELQWVSRLCLNQFLQAGFAFGTQIYKLNPHSHGRVDNSHHSRQAHGLPINLESQLQPRTFGFWSNGLDVAPTYTYVADHPSQGGAATILGQFDFAAKDKAR